MFTYAVLCSALASIGFILTYALKPEETGLRQLYWNTFFFLPYLFVWLLGKFYTKYHIYLLPLIFAANEFGSVYRAYYEDEKLSIGNALWMTVAVNWFCALLAPSYIHAIAYIFFFLIAAFWKVYAIYEGSDREKTEIIASILIIGGIMSLAVFYILQKRELTRYFETCDAQQKELQVSNGLYEQNDAIVIVTKNSIESQNQQGQDDDERRHINFEFLNKKSTELFGFDLNDDFERNEKLKKPNFIALDQGNSFNNERAVYDDDQKIFEINR